MRILNRKPVFLCVVPIVISGQSQPASTTLRNIAGIIEENQQINAIEIEI